MTSKTASEARKNLYRLIDEIAVEREPVLITGKRNNAVLVSEEDWRGIQETLHLAAIPGMVASIRRGMATPAEKMSEEPGW